MTQQPPPPDREAIARVIDPSAFDGSFYAGSYGSTREQKDAIKADEQEARQKAYAKADAILSSFPVGVGQTRIADGGQCNEHQPHAPSDSSKGI